MCVIFQWRLRLISISWTVFELAIGKIAHPSEIHLKPHWGLVTLFGDKDLGQHWLRYSLLPDGIKPLPEPMLTDHQEGLVAFVSGQFHKIPRPPFTKVSLKITCLKLNWNLPGANELNLNVTKSHSSIAISPIVLKFCSNYGSLVFVFSIKSQK